MRSAKRMLLLPVALALTLTLALTACGGGDDGDGDIATLAGDEDSGTEDVSNDADSDDPPTEEERQQALLDFAQCMREHGVDMADPQFGDGGEVMMSAGAGAGGPADKEAMDAAHEACQPIIEGVVGSGPENMDPEELERMQQEALDFAKCMREHGVDMPDPQFSDDGGGMTQSMTADPSDPTFQAAQEACGDGMMRSGVRTGEDPE